MTEKEKQNYDLVVYYLNIIFLDSKTTELLKMDKNFQEIIINDISIVKHYDLIESNQENSNRFIKSYEMLTTKKFVENTSLNFNNSNDICDTIKYTNIYLLNTLRLSIEQLDNKTSNEADVKEEASQEIPSNQTQGTYQTDEDILRNSGYSMHDVADQLVMTQANMILSKNVSKGKVYIYNSKPKFIPIIKLIIVGLLFVMFVLSIAAFALIASKNGQIKIMTNEGEKSWGVNIPTFIFQFIIVAIILCFIAFSMFKNFKNDNAKYRFSWGMMSFYLVLFLMSTFMFSWNILIDPIQYLNDPSDEAVKYTFTYAANIEIAIFAIIGVVIILTVIGAVLNPRKDEKRILKLLEQYASEIRNGQIDTSNFGGGSMFSGPFGPSNWF